MSFEDAEDNFDDWEEAGDEFEDEWEWEDESEDSDPAEDTRARSPIRVVLSAMDPGWLFVIAGALLVSALILIPAADDLRRLEWERDIMQTRVEHAASRLGAYQVFIEAVEMEDPILIERLAASQLSLVPENVKPVSMVVAPEGGLDASVDRWIEDTIPAPDWPAAPEYEQTRLRRLATGPYRLWAMLAGIIMIFIGLLPKTGRA